MEEENPKLSSDSRLGIGEWVTITHRGLNANTYKGVEICINPLILWEIVKVDYTCLTILILVRSRGKYYLHRKSTTDIEGEWKLGCLLRRPHAC
jgi:hypothetical protein